MMAGAFLCHKTSARSRRRRAAFFDNRQREDQSEDPWWMAFARAHASAFFQTFGFCLVAELQYPIFIGPALGPLALSSPRGSQEGSCSDIKAASGQKSACDRAQNRHLRLGAENTKLTRAPPIARPCRPYQRPKQYCELVRNLFYAKKPHLLQRSRSGRKRGKRAPEEAVLDEREAHPEGD